MKPIETQGNFMSYEGESRRAAFALEEDLILFEAAPELFEAVKEVVSALESYCDDWNSTQPTDVTVCLPQLKIAMAKATPEWVKETN